MLLCSVWIGMLFDYLSGCMQVRDVPGTVVSDGDHVTDHVLAGYSTVTDHVLSGRRKTKPATSNSFPYEERGQFTM